MMKYAHIYQHINISV